MRLLYTQRTNVLAEAKKGLVDAVPDGVADGGNDPRSGHHAQYAPDCPQLGCIDQMDRNFRSWPKFLVQSGSATLKVLASLAAGVWMQDEWYHSIQDY